MTGEIEVGEHGQNGGRGRIGLLHADLDDVEKRVLATLGHSHDWTPRPWWRRLWLRLRGKWPPRYYVGGSIRMPEYSTGRRAWAPTPAIRGAIQSPKKDD